MNSVDSVVSAVVKDFISAGILFTALDVSNKVKETLPLARHREVRDLVRGMFLTEIEPAGYARTPINVVLDDGSMTGALLYHPLSDSWDLDNKYDSQQRAQKASKPTQYSNPTTITVNPVAATATIASQVPVNVTVPAVTSQPDPVVLPTRYLWDAMFKSQPSLFPRK
jgi:hypothetical protein